MKTIYFISFLGAAYSTYVLWLLLLREEYSKTQKVFQFIFVIFIPLIGAFIVHGMIKEFDRIPEPKNPNDGLAKDCSHEYG